MQEETTEMLIEAARLASEQVHREARALGITTSICKADGVYRIYPDGREELIQKGDFTRKSITKREFILKKNG
ncbi:MAG: hypothetical protein RLZZ292_2152 [Bacteroidota bacterium]|jgi:hypothetical protein